MSRHIVWEDQKIYKKSSSQVAAKTFIFTFSFGAHTPKYHQQERFGKKWNHAAQFGMYAPNEMYAHRENSSHAGY